MILLLLNRGLLPCVREEGRERGCRVAVYMLLDDGPARLVMLRGSVCNLLYCSQLLHHDHHVLPPVQLQ